MRHAKFSSAMPVAVGLTFVVAMLGILGWQSKLISAAQEDSVLTVCPTGPPTCQFSIVQDAQQDGRVIHITGDISPTIEGLNITGGSAEGKGDARFDIGASEFDMISPILDYNLFLPHISDQICRDFFDDFSDPTSGWPVVDDPYVTANYVDDMYRIKSKQSGYLYLFGAPSCARERYTVETDVRWAGTPGSSYGLLFGISADFEHYYLFDINTDYKLYRLFRRDPAGFYEIVPISEAPMINGGNGTNRLTVLRGHNAITLLINGSSLGTWHDTSITGFTFTGVMESPYSDHAASDARFDNFSVTTNQGRSSERSDAAPMSNEPRVIYARIVSREPFSWNTLK